MWSPPTESQLAKLPRLYETEQTDLQDKIVHLHFFIFGSDWYAVEFDGEDIFFGYVILNNDDQMAEWGYFSLSELKAINVNGFEIECDQYWTPKLAKDINKIRKGMGLEVKDAV